MIHPESLIELINKCCKKSVGATFNLKQSTNSPNLLQYRIDGTVEAINRFDFPLESVKILRWFNDFWLFIKIIIEKKKTGRKAESETHIGISLSIFQGEENAEKYQLFRAEWDDFNNPDEKHAQPHWHITSNQAIEKSLKEYSSYDNDFSSILEQEKNKILDVRKIHFAMNGNWQNGDNHIHKMEDEQQIVKWLQGMLYYLRTELESCI